MATRSTGLPTYSGRNPTFVLETRDLPELKSGQVLVEALYLSNDPSQRTWMSSPVAENRHYVSLIEPGSVMRGRGIVKILQSTSLGSIKKGDLGYGPPLKPLPHGLDMTHHIGSLDLTGMEKIGADKCLNYKSPTFEGDLAAATKDTPIDVYFDNVGGEILDKMLGGMATNGRVAICSAISAYNGGNAARGCFLSNYFLLLTMRLTLRGFFVHDFANNEAEREFTKAILGSNMLSKSKTVDAAVTQDTVVVGTVEDIPKIWLRLFEGANQGKLITKLVK